MQYLFCYLIKLVLQQLLYLVTGKDKSSIIIKESRSQGVKESRSQGIKESRSQGIKESRSQSVWLKVISRIKLDF
ncbi:hypothetical protein A9Q98_06215 [Thalassotalea sp. 42_200_T64]|nr:hypothetical protein A9Q98_06215 [Thalassotalea sp. 42_200_T64]